MNTKPNRFETVLGLSVIFGLMTGIASLLAAVFAFFNADWTGAGICLVAAALVFGLLANALLHQ